MLGNGVPKPAGIWDYYGECDPAHDKSGYIYHTFSVGVFQWVSKASGKGTKRGKIVARIKGDVADPQSVYKAAKARIESLE